MKLSVQGFPFCPKCGGILYWNSDFTKGELCLVPEYSEEADDVIHSLSCYDCETDWYYIPDDKEETFIEATKG